MIYVKDLARMEAFYREALGLTPVEETRSTSWLEFDAGQARLALHTIPPHFAERIEITSPPLPREETPIKLIFEVDNLTDACERIRAAGATPILRCWGSWDCVDPEGNVFGLSVRARPQSDVG